MAPKIEPMETQVAFRITNAQKEHLEREAWGDTLSEAARRRLNKSFADHPELLVEVKTVADELRDRKLTAEVESKERANKIALGELIPKDDALAELEQDYGQIRQRLQQLKNSVDGLSDAQREQLEKAVEDCMTDLSGDGHVFG